MSRRRKRREAAEVTLNLAAMLDMAFQLLTFFILTFRPAPVEGQISLRLPPPQSVVVRADGQKAGSDFNNPNPVQGLNTLVISVYAEPQTGMIQTLAVGTTPLQGLTALDKRLREVFSDPGNPFDQVIVQVSEDCRYDQFMKVVDICTRQTLPDGKPLTKFSPILLPNAPSG